jgi:hypothetical protein
LQKLLYLKKNLIKNGSLLVLGFKADANQIKIPNPGAPGSSPGRAFFLCPQSLIDKVLPSECVF